MVSVYGVGFSLCQWYTLLDSLTNQQCAT